MIDTVLVLGSTGKSGRRLSERLLAKGLKVRRASRRAVAGFTFFDWNRPETHTPALEGVDAVYLIPPEGVEDPTPVVGPFLEQARALRVSRVVALTSLAVEFPNEKPGAGVVKLEKQILSSGLPWTILRPSGFNQNFSESFLQPGILHADTIATATGDGAVAFVDADDIAAVAEVAIVNDGHAGQIYPVTGPQPLTFDEAAAILSKVLGRTIQHRRLTSDEFRGMLESAGIPSDYAAEMVSHQEGIRGGHGARVASTVETLTGRPAIQFADFARAAANVWMRA